jgi:hypothetical protein
MKMIRKILRLGLKRKILRMRLVLVFSSLAVLFLMSSACDQRSTTYVTDDDHTAPPVPSGVTTITGDGVVWVQWNPIYGVPDLDGFRIWRGRDNLEFFLIATVSENADEYADYDVTNGITYYYGVTAFDVDGNESDASFDHGDFAFDTPRPEGRTTIYDPADPSYEDRSGFNFDHEIRVYWDNALCDINLEYDDTPGIETFFIWLGPHGLAMQDMGYTDDFDEITYAPEDGWAELPYVEAIVGHTYVVLTDDDNYAKIRILDFDYSPWYAITFDWGYQIDPGNRELKIEPPDGMTDVPDEEISQ